MAIVWQMVTPTFSVRSTPSSHKSPATAHLTHFTQSTTAPKTQIIAPSPASAQTLPPVKQALQTPSSLPPTPILNPLNTKTATTSVALIWKLQNSLQTILAKPLSSRIWILTQLSPQLKQDFATSVWQASPSVMTVQKQSVSQILTTAQPK